MKENCHLSHIWADKFYLRTNYLTGGESTIELSLGIVGGGGGGGGGGQPPSLTSLDILLSHSCNIVVPEHVL